jgi:hypothetical protein
MVAAGILALFSASGAIVAQRGGSASAAPSASDVREDPTPRSRDESPSARPTARTSDDPVGRGTPSPLAKPSGAPPPPANAAAAKPPVPLGTIAPVVVPQDTPVAKRIDRDVIGGGLKVTAVGGARSNRSPEESVLALYIRMWNQSGETVRVDPGFFRVADRSGKQYQLSRVIEPTLIPIELGPRPNPADPGINTEGTIQFELPRSAVGLVLQYQAPGGPLLSIPLPPEFG